MFSDERKIVMKIYYWDHLMWIKWNSYIEFSLNFPVISLWTFQTIFNKSHLCQLILIPFFGTHFHHPINCFYLLIPVWPFLPSNIFKSWYYSDYYLMKIHFRTIRIVMSYSYFRTEGVVIYDVHINLKTKTFLALENSVEPGQLEIIHAKLL